MPDLGMPVPVAIAPPATSSPPPQLQPPQQSQHAAHHPPLPQRRQMAPQDAAELHQMRTALAGAVAAAVARVFVQPLDVLKIRFQLQVEPLNRRGLQEGRGSKYTSLWQVSDTRRKLTRKWWFF